MYFLLARSVALCLIACWSPLLAASPVAKPAYTLVLQTPPATSVDSVAVSPDGALVATAAGEGGVRLYDAKTGALVRTLGDVGDRDVVFAPDGASLTAAGFHMDKLVKVMDVHTGRRTQALAGHTEWEADATAISPDGSILATGGKSVQLWDVRTGGMLRELFGHLKRTQSIVFSADGRRVFAGGSYGTTNIWDVATGRHLITLFAFTGDGTDAKVDDWLAYTPEGFYAGSAGVERYLAWQSGDELLTAETLGPQLHRPERVAK